MKNDNPNLNKLCIGALVAHMRSICPSAYDDCSTQLDNSKNTDCSTQLDELKAKLVALSVYVQNKRIKCNELNRVETMSLALIEKLDNCIKTAQSDVQQKENIRNHKWFQTLEKEEERYMYLDYATWLSKVDNTTILTSIELEPNNAIVENLTSCIKTLCRLNQSIQDTINLINDIQIPQYENPRPSL